MIFLKKYSYILIIGLILIVGIIIFKYTSKSEKNNNECINIMGGGFSIIFETNGGEKIDNMSVCIACSPDSYDDLPTPEKEKNVFDGWYFDEGLTIPVESESTIDITPVTNVDSTGCIIGYKDITLYAKWK